MPPKGGYSKDLLEQLTSDRWLNLNPNEKFSSVLKPTLEDKENPHLYLFKLFRKPENLYLTAKYVFGVDLALFQMVVLQEMYRHTFPMLIGSRGMSKSFLLAFYALWKCFINQGSQIVITASSFRQAKFVFTYAAKMFEKAKILQDLLNYRKGSNEKNGPKWDTDRCEMFIGESTIVAIPLGHDGGKIRGQRASTLIIDERATVPTDVVQRVLFGFAAVSQDPVEKMKRQARMDALKELGLWTPEMDDEESKLLKSNQSIVSGSAYYQFNDFYKEYKQYKEIITSRGDRTKMEELFGGEVPPGISHKDFCVIRLPYELLPKGFMDDKTISRAKATFSKSTYLMEYSAVFVGDSEGFFRRSTIESCVTHKPITLASGDKVKFSARVKGSQACKYVYGIDPASEQDNFAIVILEVYEDHSRVVYCWTSRKDIHKKKIAAGLAIDQNFYYYCVSKIRELMVNFPCLRIGIDSQGGGNQIIDLLGDANLLKRGEQPIFEIIDRDKPKPTDLKHGLHIVEKIQFVKSDWTSEANHGLKSDLENKNILFPFLDVSELASSKALKEESRDGEFLEDCALEIEEMKDELAKIVITQTENGTERWDTPATKGEGGKKTRERKDRYSALLIANMVARSHRRAIAHAPPPYVPVGGDAARTNKIISTNELYVGPEWFTRGVNNAKLYRGV